MGNALGTPPTGPNALPLSAKAASKDDEAKLRNFTLQELAACNGSDNNPIYVALKSDVFDVAAQRNVYGPGGESHVLAGKDASFALATQSTTKEAANCLDLSTISDAESRVLEEWLTRFREENKFPLVGRLILPQDLTQEQLRSFNGTDEARGTVLVALCGIIYDVTLDGWTHYGPEGAYSQFAGRDASRALACMSFDPECLDDPRLDELSPEQHASLNEWTKKFQGKYPAVGKLLP